LIGDLRSARGYLALGGVALLVGCLGSCRSSESDRQDRRGRIDTVVFITVDALRADYVGLQGRTPSPTPRLDAFFGDKTIFLNASTSAPCTNPSVLRDLSGCRDPLECPSLAQILAANGFHTGAVVSQHQFGWAPSPKAKYARGFDFFDVQPKMSMGRHLFTTRRAGRVTGRALRWIDKVGAGEKLFLWLHYFDPHDPYSPPRGFCPAVDTSGDRRTALQQAPGEVPWSDRGSIFSAKQVDDLRALYTGEIRYVDNQVGRLLDGLDERHRLATALVVVTADHGEWLGERDRWDHCLTLHANELNVPLLIAARGRRLAELGRVRWPVSTLDIVPTILDVLGIEAKGLDGQSLRDDTPRRSVAAHWKTESTLVTERWKLRSLDDEATGLYDIQDDPRETRNLLRSGDASAIANAEKVAKGLAADLAAKGGRTVDADRRVTDELKALGYID